MAPYSNLKWQVEFYTIIWDETRSVGDIWMAQICLNLSLRRQVGWIESDPLKNGSGGLFGVWMKRRRL